jgi:hypothetical protein
MAAHDPEVRIRNANTAIRARWDKDAPERAARKLITWTERYGPSCQPELVAAITHLAGLIGRDGDAA